MRVINLKPLREFWATHADAEETLRLWLLSVGRADWQSPTDIKKMYANASFVANNRVIFNIRGNTYRLTVAVNYKTGIVYVRFIGTHADYDCVNAATI